MLNRLLLLVLFYGGCATPQSESGDAASDQPTLPALPKNEGSLGGSLLGTLAGKPLKKEAVDNGGKGAAPSGANPESKSAVGNDAPIVRDAPSQQEEASNDRHALVDRPGSKKTSKRDFPDPEVLQEFSGEEIEPTDDNEPVDGEPSSANKPPSPSAGDGGQQSTDGEGTPPIKGSAKGSAPSPLHENVVAAPTEQKNAPSATQEPPLDPSPENDPLPVEAPIRDASSLLTEDDQSPQVRKDDPAVPAGKQNPIERTEIAFPEPAKVAITETNNKEVLPVRPDKEVPAPPAAESQLPQHEEESQLPQLQKDEPVAPLSKQSLIESDGMDRLLPEPPGGALSETNNKEDSPVAAESPDSTEPSETGSPEKTLKDPSIGSVPIDREPAGGRPRIYFNRPESTDPKEGVRGLRPRFVFRKQETTSSSQEKNPRARLSFFKAEKPADASGIASRRPNWSSLLRPSSEAIYGSSDQLDDSIGDDYSKGSKLGLNWNLAGSTETPPQPVAIDHSVNWKVPDTQDSLLANAQYISEESYTETIRWLKWKPRTRDLEILDLDIASDPTMGDPSPIRWLKWKPRKRDLEILDLPLGPSLEYSKTVKWLSVNREP